MGLINITEAMSEIITKGMAKGEPCPQCSQGKQTWHYDSNFYF